MVLPLSSSYYQAGFTDCCERKVDILTLGVVLVAIAALSVFLRQAVIDNNIMAAGKRRKREASLINDLITGMKLVE